MMKVTFGLILLLLALIGLTENSLGQDAATLQDIRLLVANHTIRTGSTMISLSLQEEAEWRRVHFQDDHRRTVVIFTGCTDCQLRDMDNALRLAQRQGDKCIIVLNASKEKYIAVRKRFGSRVEIYRNTNQRLLTSIGISILPTTVIVSPDGVVERIS